MLRLNINSFLNGLENRIMLLKISIVCADPVS